MSSITLPHFDIDANSIVKKLQTLLDENKQQLEQCLKSHDHPTWDTLITTLSELDERLDEYWSPIAHLHGVMNSKPLRAAYEACLPLLSDYSTELSQNEQLYESIVALTKQPAYEHYNRAQKKLLSDLIRDFKLSGVALPKDKKEIYKTLVKKLSELTNQFSNHVMDATDAWFKCITDEKELAGLPQRAIDAAKELAEKNKQTGWRFSLKFPSFYAVMTYADSRAFREEMYTAYVTRASDQGPNAKQWDNSHVMEEILKVRHQLANLVSFNQYAEYSLATKMASSSEEVLSFLEDLAKRAKPYAQKEYEELASFAREQGVSELKPWDLSYFSEKLRQKKFNLSEEKLREYFPEEKVLSGMFELVRTLYGITLKQNTTAPTWHSDVKCYELYDQHRTLRGILYVDLYARPHKRGGAWMDDGRTHWRNRAGEITTPIAFLTCNFTAPTANQSALLNFEEVLTLFHEFGHCLHHLLTTVEYYDLSGTNGVEWDAVELPSQFMENFCWDRTVLNHISAHYQTQEPLPEEYYQQMLASKNFQAGMQMVRQLEFSLFDFKLHCEYDLKTPKPIQAVLDEVRAQVAVVPTVPFNRFQHSFSHIFSGGYAAGYYSYKWAEVLSSDAFSLFEETGVLNAATGQQFLHHILEKGGSEPALDLFVGFRGRKPTIDALLRHHGMAE